MKKTISLVLVLAFCLAMSGLAQAATIAVGPGAGYEFDTIQAGIDVANEGDIVLVAPGEYVITEPITFRGKAIAVRSEVGRDETTIRMGTPTDPKRASVVIFENNETEASILEGFTITGGTGSWVSSASAYAGGGIYFDASSGTIRNCAIVQNRAENAGGGVLVYSGSSATLTNCIISENSSKNGGGIFSWENASVTITDCIIRGNSATGSTPHVSGYGGGLHCGMRCLLAAINCNIAENSAGVGGGGIQCGVQSSVTVANSVISENSVGVIGGAMFCEQNSSVTMADCIVSGNSAGTWGGGIECFLNASLTMTNCEVISNTSQRQGGGVECSDHSSMTLTNCLIARNSAAVWGGGLSCDKPGAFMTVHNCTIWGNSAGQTGGAMGCDKGASAMVTNTIIWGNTAPKGSEIWVRNGGTFSINNSDAAGGQAAVFIEGGTINWGAGNIDADPCFTDPENDDYHLKSQAGRWDSDSQTWIQDDITSPCIDAGDPMSPIGLELFPNGGFVNMGAYGGRPEASKAYFGEPVCETIMAGDINGDGQVNRADLEIMALHWTDDVPLALP